MLKAMECRQKHRSNRQPLLINHAANYLPLNHNLLTLDRMVLVHQASRNLPAQARRTVAPEPLKILFEQVSADGSEVLRLHANRSLSLSTCFPVRFSGHFKRHQRHFVRRGSFPFFLSSLVSSALTSSIELS